MSGSEVGRAKRYVRAVEAMWTAHAERPIVLSPREFALAADWHARGIPLDLIRDAIRAREDRPNRRARTVRSLQQIASSVEESWTAIRDGQLRQEAGSVFGSGSRTDADRVEEWARRLERQAAHGALGAFFRDLAERARHGTPAPTIEEELEARLPDLAPEDLLERAVREIDRDLAPYQGRMPPERLAATRRRAIGVRLRLLIGL